MPRRELDLQKQIVQAVVDAGGAARVHAQSGTTTVGDSDIYGCLKGKFIYLEVKDGFDFPVSKIQKHRLMEWWKAGAWAYSVRSFNDAERIIKIILADSAFRLHQTRGHPDIAHLSAPRVGT